MRVQSFFNIMKEVIIMKKKYLWLILLMAFFLFPSKGNVLQANEDILVEEIYLESSYLETPDRQFAGVSLKGDINEIQSIKLIYQDEHNNAFEWESEYKEDNAYIFIKAFEDDESGIYQLTAIEYVKNGVKHLISLEDMEQDFRFGVNSLIQQEMISEQAAFSADTKAFPKSDEIIIIAIDAGHGGGPCGWNATYKVTEKEINLKIAKYLKQELETYSGVEVVMTRESDVHVELEDRVKIAAAADADAFISLHLNGWNGKTYGAEVYYPNKSLYPAVGQEGKALAQAIQDELCKLGLYNRGIKVRDSEVERYRDGSIGDYYSVIKYSKLSGFPGIIVEHAFLDNNTEYLKFLNTDAKIKNLALADAAGIAKHYGLTKTPAIYMDEFDEFDGTCKITMQGLGNNAKVKISNGDNAQTINVPNGRTEIAFDITAYNNARGTYKIEVFNSSGTLIYEEEFYILKDTGCNVSVEEVKKEEEYLLQAQFIDKPATVGHMKFNVWSEENGKDDLVTYSAKDQGNGLWSTSATLEKHMNAGTFMVEAIAVLENGKEKMVGTGSFEVEYPSVNVKIENCDFGKGTFDVVLSEPQAFTGVEKVRVAVSWKERYKDMKWYDLEIQEDGTYRITVNIANHLYREGVYVVDGYVVAKNGLCARGGTATQEMTMPTEVEIVLPFTDCKKTDWFYESVKYTCIKGIMSGVSDKLFQPQQSLTRAQFAALIYRLQDEPDVEYRPVFQDVPEDTWYTDAVLWANENEIIYGYGNGLFGTNNKITREEMATMMLRYGNFCSYEMDKREPLSKFSDANKVSGYAEEPMQWAVAEGILVGEKRGTKVFLNPKGTAKRCEGAAIIERFMKKYGE